MNPTYPDFLTELPAEPAALIEAVLGSDRRVLLVGPPGGRHAAGGAGGCGRGSDRGSGLSRAP